MPSCLPKAGGPLRSPITRPPSSKDDLEYWMGCSLCTTLPPLPPFVNFAIGTIKITMQPAPLVISQPAIATLPAGGGLYRALQFPLRRALELARALTLHLDQIAHRDEPRRRLCRPGNSGGNRNDNNEPNFHAPSAPDY